MVKNAAAIAEAFRKNGMPVFLVRVTPSPDGKDALHPVVDDSVPRPTPPPDWADIVPEMGPKQGARFAYEYGYNQIFAEDAMSAMSNEEHLFTITKIFSRIGLVRKTGDILENLS